MATDEVISITLLGPVLFWIMSAVCSVRTDSANRQPGSSTIRFAGSPRTRFTCGSKPSAERPVKRSICSTLRKPRSSCSRT